MLLSVRFITKLITITISAAANNENSTVVVDAGRGPAGFTSVNGTHKQQYDGNGGAGHMIYDNTATQWYVSPQYSTKYQSSVMLNDKWYPMQCGGFQYTVVAGANDPPAQAYAPTYAPTQDPPNDVCAATRCQNYYPCTTASGTDSVTITMYPEGTNLQSIDITLGNSTPARVLVDTGASILNIKESVGNSLIASGEATVLKTSDSIIRRRINSHRADDQYQPDNNWWPHTIQY